MLYEASGKLYCERRQGSLENARYGATGLRTLPLGLGSSLLLEMLVIWMMIRLRA